MARASTHPKLVLTDEEKKHLDQLRQSKTASFRDVQRAQVVWRYYAGETVSQIALALNMTVGGGEKGYQFGGRDGARCGVTLWPAVGAGREQERLLSSLRPDCPRF